MRVIGEGVRLKIWPLNYPLPLGEELKVRVIGEGICKDMKASCKSAAPDQTNKHNYALPPATCPPHVAS